MEEKRTYRRYNLWFPVTLERLGGALSEPPPPPSSGARGNEVWAICRDASPSGILVSSMRPIPPGTVVRVRFRIRPMETADRVLEGSIVRSEQNADDLTLAFPYRAAVEFRSALPDLLDELESATRTVPTS